MLNLQSKHEIIRKVECGASKSSISRKYSIGVSTVFDILKSKTNIQQLIEEIDCEEVIKKRCTARKADNEMLDKALNIWFLQERSKGTPISGDLILEKAKRLHEVYKRILKSKTILSLLQAF